MTPETVVQIIREALISDEQQYVFVSPLGDQPMNRKMMATALRGTKYRNGNVKSPVSRSSRVERQANLQLLGRLISNTNHGHSAFILKG